MATTLLMPLHTGKGRTVGTAIEAIIDYVENPEKTDSDAGCSGIRLSQPFGVSSIPADAGCKLFG